MGDIHHSQDIEQTPLFGNDQRDWRTFPWWFPSIILVFIWFVYIIFTQDNFTEAFNFIKAGIWITIRISLFSYAIALVIGILAGLGRVSKNVILHNLATFYIELVRGIPMLVLIFYIALVLVPTATDFIGLANKEIEMSTRAVIALSLTYGAFLAEIFRAGIQSIPVGQMEAARSLGMSYRQAMRYVILPQAIRNVLPALGNDFIAMVKDSSLVSVLAVRDITQVARLYAGRSFRFREAYTTLALLYLAMTVSLSLILQFIERRLSHDD